MNEKDAVEFIEAAVYDYIDFSYKPARKVMQTTIFENAGILTNNKGLVVRMQDGSEFQVTVVQSMWAKDGE